MKIKIVVLIISSLIITNLLGCDAFVRKFTRKKKSTSPREEMVIAPQEYKPTMTHAEMYRQYFLYWKSWQDELIESLLRTTNHKKKVGCVAQALENMLQLKRLLNDQTKLKLDKYIQDMKDLQAVVDSDLYDANAVSIRQQAERIRRNFLRDFSFDKVKGSIV